MAFIEVSGRDNGPMIPAGEYLMDLTGHKKVEVAVTDPRYKKTDDPNEKRGKMIWEFVADPNWDGYDWEADIADPHPALDPESGKPYEFSHWTSTKYGHPKSNLTAFLNMLIPGLDKEKAEELDESDIYPKKYIVNIIHNKSENGNVYANLLSIKPFKVRRKRDTAAAKPDLFEEE